MNSNFKYLVSTEFKKLSATLIDAELQAFAAPQYSAVLCRKSLEEWVRWLYENDVDLELPKYDTSLNTLMYDQSFKDLLAPNLFKQANLVRKLGNDAVHTSIRELSKDERITAIAKMLSGEKPTAAAIENAREMIMN